MGWLSRIPAWTPPRKIHVSFVAFCVVIASASIVVIIRMQLLVSSNANYDTDDEASSLIPCLNLTTVYKRVVRKYRKAVKTLSPSMYMFSNQTSSKPKMKTAERLAISSSVMKTKNINCMEVITSSHDNLREVQNRTHTEVPICDSLYPSLTADCSLFKKYRGYITTSLTEEEESFPLAYSMIVYKDAEMVERLLRAIYRPQNYYCIHVDGKSSVAFYRAIADIANCFTNVMLTSRRIEVTWGTFSVLEPELLCMEELWRFPRWRYFLTLTGQEFPLKTNYELVKILKAFKGANDILTTVTYATKSRWKNTVPPLGIVPVKGSVHITVNRDFVDYILHNGTAKEILEWTRQTEIPDEAFFAVLGANPQLGIRGTYKGNPELSIRNPFLSRYKNWGSLPCAGRFVRDICILTTGDLHLLFKAKEMFANKFFLQEDRIVIGCLEEKIFNDTRDEYLGTKTFETSYYESLDFVKNQVT
ncbi:unnamed protein product [Candidula unifasciata]|uniref:Beta-1,3-galactosyl-O-glycosyl-glycoprotein beta-1,6-N-acetylglucosaminyltransferase n=1 Tax=Candidula unifasciata TaxID=100452 RepID=A0A8S3ZBH9_9EUPU|nr:unnamed protein product [Candidula unifasciata]